jgi:glucose/arabinose dehydrogenase
VLQPAPVATVKISTAGESGLLGIAAHPDFASNHQFYIYVTTDVEGAPRNRVERWTLSEDHTRATFDRVILGGIPAATYHDGGRIRFGPDGMLYVGTGDAGEPSNSQNVDTPSGKLLRLTPEGEVPADNPFPGKAAFLLGIRNLQGFDWKDQDTLYVTDHGPSGELLRRGHDEVNVVHKGDNLGWPTLYSCETGEGLVTPSLTWDEAVPPGGAALYTGDAIPEWKGSLLVGSLGARHLHRVVFSADNPRRVTQHEVYLRNEWGRLRETLMGPDGHLYVTTSNCDSRGDCQERKDVILRIRR